jgi:FkbM family methyltransferase
MSALETIILELPKFKNEHNKDSVIYKMLEKIANAEIKKLFFDASQNHKTFQPFGNIIFPYFKMGTIDSLDLFGLDELIIFSFYWFNKNIYKNVLDLGGNIGIHSIILSKCGYNVKTYEPDPMHFAKLSENLDSNNCTNVIPVKAAVSSKKGTAEFVRVLGNTTSSHLKGCKNPYGDLETFSVDLENFKDIVGWADLIKMDVEGHEKELLLLMDKKDFSHSDIIAEIGSEENAKIVFEHLQDLDINAFAQKKGWAIVKTVEDMPTSHREGSLFITTKKAMPW